MTFFFHPEAEEEFLAAINYYDDAEAGLGHDFSVEVLTTLQNIITHPTAWPLIEDDVRRCLVNRFPFGVLYTIEPTGVIVLAVMHLRRWPGYWKKRR